MQCTVSPYGLKLHCYNCILSLAITNYVSGNYHAIFSTGNRCKVGEEQYELISEHIPPNNFITPHQRVKIVWCYIKQDCERFYCNGRKFLMMTYNILQ